MQPSTRPVSEPFPVKHVVQVEPLAAERQWLVEGLWLAQGVGILGGAPKCCKTWLAAELAVAVASGAPALGRFAVHTPGPVLVFCAEDSPPALRTRFDGIAAARDLVLADAPVMLLDVDALRLDREADLARLRATVAQLQPRLLVLDPFVRLARIDENSATEVSAVLGALRTLQREHALAVLVVHHARKSPAAHPGQSLRGSSDFAAWGDSNLYLSRHGDALGLSVEHRNASAPPRLGLRLEALPAPHLVVDDVGDIQHATDSPGSALAELVVARLAAVTRPLSTLELARHLRRRKQAVVDALDALRLAGRVDRRAGGWSLLPPRS